MRIHSGNGPHEEMDRRAIASLEVSGGEVSAQLGDDQPERVCAQLVTARVGVRGLDMVSPSLEQMFLELTREESGIHD